MVDLGERQADDNEVDPTEKMGPIRTKMYNIEKAILGPDEEEEIDPQKLEQILRDMPPSDTAFVVFDTSEDAEKALAKAKDSGVKFEHFDQETILTLEPTDAEPTVMNWQNFGDSS